jgi:peptidyl-prolyl cis-trans isomerase SurA
MALPLAAGAQTAPAEPAAAPAAAPAAPAAPADGQPAAQKRGLTEGVVALVNDEIVSSYDLRQRMLLLIVTSGVQPTQESLPGIQQQALRSLVDERLEMQELKHYDLKIDDREVDDEIEDIAKENKTTKDKLLGGLKDAGVDPRTLRDQLRAQIGWRVLISEKFRSRARVGDDEVAQALERISASQAKPQYLVGEIYIDAQSVGGMDEAMNGARQLVDQIQKGAPFTAVARQFSNDPSAASGGDAGWLVSGEMDPNVELALQQMRPGQMSMPIPSDKGVWIVYLRDKHMGGTGSVLHLAQAAVRLKPDAPDADVEAAKAKLDLLAPSLTCKNYEAEAGKVGVIASDLGESDATELSPEFRTVTEALKVGQVSQPVRTSAGLHLVLLCGKRPAGEGVLTKDQMENKLFSQQLSMLAERYLRDLRNSAMIETR